MTRTARPIRMAALLGVTCLLALLAPPTVAVGQGSADPTLQVSPSTLATDRVTDLTVSGTGYLVPPHAPDVDVFGGVYVFFGWVDDPNRFGPSIRNSNDNDGTFGVSYAYPGEGGDAATRDDGSGQVRLVAFTEGGESGDATDYHMDDQGNWATTIRVYGSTFTSTDPATDETTTYDCTQVQCGVFTIGAHGKPSSTNEVFTPVSFSPAAVQDRDTETGDTAPPDGDPDDPTTAPSTGQPASGDGHGDEAPTTPTDDAPTGDAPTADGPAATDATTTPATDDTDTASPPSDRPSTSATGDHATTGALAVGVRSTRTVGGSSAGPLAVAAAAAVVVGVLWWWRRRRTAAISPHPPDLE